MGTPSGNRPTVGRIVMFHTTVDTYAALVVGVYGDPWDKVDLLVFSRPPVGYTLQNVHLYYALGVRLGTDPGAWSWPRLVGV